MRLADIACGSGVGVMLADRIEPVVARGFANGIAARLREAAVVVADNVGEWLYGTNEQEVFDGSDYPCCVPPFASTFVEHRRPTRYVSSDSSINCEEQLQAMPRCNGDLVYAERMSDGWRVGSFQVFSLDGRTAQVSPIAFLVELNAAGAMASAPCNVAFGLSREDMEAMGRLATTQRYWPHVALMTFSLMHCRNVTTVEQRPPQGLQRKRARKGLPPLVTFKTLEIGQARALVDAEAKRSGASIVKSLHICRGHFKTYDERPLFGRTRGTFWWPASVRGDAAAGVVVKDYRMKPEAGG